MKRGDICWANLSPRSGSEQSGRRPVVIISHDGFNQTPTWRSLIVVPITTSEKQGHRGPTIVPLNKGSAGFNQKSYIICHQITTLDRSKLTQHIGSLSNEGLESLEKALKAALDLL